MITINLAKFTAVFVQTEWTPSPPQKMPSQNHWQHWIYVYIYVNSRMGLRLSSIIRVLNMQKLRLLCIFVLFGCYCCDRRQNGTESEKTWHSHSKQFNDGKKKFVFFETMTNQTITFQIYTKHFGQPWFCCYDIVACVPAPAPAPAPQIKGDLFIVLDICIYLDLIIYINVM